MPEPTTATTTLEHLLSAFADHVSALVASGARSEATLCMHREHLGWLLSHLNGSTPLVAIDERVIDTLVREIRRGQRGRAIAEGTVAKRLSTLRQAFKLAKRWRWIDRMPEFPAIERRYRPRRNHLRTPEELARLFRELPLERAEWVALAVFTGQHPSDVDRMQAFIDADPFARPPWMVVRNTKNRKRERTVVMPSVLATLMRARFRRLEIQHGDSVVDQWPKALRYKALRAAGERAGLMRMTATALRHTCGTWAVHQLRAVTKGAADWLGHSSTTMLEHVYAHALPPALREVSAALDQFARPRMRLLKVSLSAGVSGGGKRKPPRSIPLDQGGRKPTRGARRGPEEAGSVRSGPGDV